MRIYLTVFSSCRRRVAASLKTWVSILLRKWNLLLIYMAFSTVYMSRVWFPLIFRWCWPKLASEPCGESCLISHSVFLTRCNRLSSLNSFVISFWISQTFGKLEILSPECHAMISLIVLVSSLVWPNGWTVERWNFVSGSSTSYPS